MDPHAFDRFARACAAGGTRRRLVALLATLPVAGLLTTRARDAAAADRKLGGEPCNENRDCQTTICSESRNRCTCSNLLPVACADPAERCWEQVPIRGMCIRPALGGVACEDEIECQSNQCLEGRCSCSDGPTGIPCKDRAQLCLNGRCGPLKRGGEPCNEDRECQTNTCDTGVCSCANGDRPVPCVELANPCVKQVCVAQECRRQKRDDGTACPSAGDPCAKDVCLNGQCTHPPKPDGAACPSAGNPCAKDVCANGQCTHPAKSDGAACPEDGNPCTDDVCANGQCTHPFKRDGAKCGDGGSCQHGTCQCDAATEQVCPGKRGTCKLPLGQACTRDAQCCPEQTCCRGQCRLKSGQGGCRTDDDCCVTHTAAGPICCGGTCCYTCQGCNDVTKTCVGGSGNHC
jgi:hypothetical protein